MTSSFRVSDVIIPRHLPRGRVTSLIVEREFEWRNFYCFFCFDFLILILIELKTSWLDQIECNSPIRVGKFRPAEICILRGISRTNLRIVIVGAETRKIVAFDCGIGFCNLIPILVWLPNPTKWIHGLNGFCNTNSSVVAKPYLLFQSIELGSAT